MTGIKISEYDQEILHSLQTDPWHLEEEAQNNNSHNTSVRQLKLKKTHQDDCKTRKNTYYKTKQILTIIPARGAQ